MVVAAVVDTMAEAAVVMAAVAAVVVLLPAQGLLPLLILQVRIPETVN
jgi:hypothetical protein